MNELHEVFRGITEGVVSLVRMDPKTKKVVSTEFFSITDLDSAYERALELAPRGHVYFNFNVLRAAPHKGRGTERDISAAGGVFLDVDLKSPESGVHAANEQLPSSVGEVLGLIKERGLPEPTHIVNSGNGAYFRYLFDEPVNFKTESERKAFQAASSAFHAVFSEAFRSRVWKLDNMSDPARITRLPGTLNHKTNPPKEVTLMDEYSGERLSLAAFYQIAEMRKQVAGSSVAPAVHRQTSKDMTPQADPTADFKAMIKGCAWVQSLGPKMDHLRYSEWYTVAGLLKHCKDGRELFHELSKVDPRYEPQETDRLFDSVEGPIRCSTIAQDCGADICPGCPALSNAHVGTPVFFGEQVPEVAAALSSHVFVTKRSLFFHLPTLTAYTKEQFADKHKRYFKTPVEATIGNKGLLQPLDTDYLPGTYNAFVTGTHSMTFNLWRPGHLVPTEGDCSITLAHLEYLIPGADERRHFLDALAHAVQHPGKKIRHCMLLVGPQGTGKSWIEHLLRLLCGDDNVVTVTNDMLSNRFKAKMGNQQVAILEEVGQTDRQEAYNEMKLWISQDKVQVEEKSQPMFDARTPYLMIGFSNREIPIKIEADDRRFMFIKTADEPRKPEYYDVLFTGGLNEAGAFFHFLLCRDIRHFNPNARPPVTALKASVVAGSRPFAEVEIMSMLDHGEFPFDQEYFTLKDVVQVLQGRAVGRPNLSSTQISSVLKKLGYAPVEAAQIRVWSKPMRFWTSVGSRWMTASPDELRKSAEQNAYYNSVRF